MCFVGRSQKPTWNYRFIKNAIQGTGEAQREAKIQSQIAICEAQEADRKARQAARNRPHGLEVGTIFYSSWGVSIQGTPLF